MSDKGLGNQNKTFSRRVWTLSENGEFGLAISIAIFLTVAIRLVEYSAWQVESLMVNGEPLMATHDAYAWLAGAKGVGYYAVSRFAAMIRLIHDLTGIALGTIGFWLPVVVVPMLAIPACLLARVLRMSEAGVVFSVLTGSSLGYLVRTRLGFCDTDLVSLFFPVIFVGALIVWVSSQTRSLWQDTDDFNVSKWQNIFLLLLTGFFGKANVLFYPKGGSLLLAILGVTAFVGLVLSRRGRRPHIYCGIVLIYAMIYGGIYGLFGVFLASLVLALPNLLQRRDGLVMLTLLSVGVAYFTDLHSLVFRYAEMVLAYSKHSDVDLVSNASSLKLPPIIQSVREAQNIQWNQVMERIAGSAIIFILGVISFIFAVVRRPQLLIFLPFLVLGLASVKLGNRFAMYGGVALGAGLGFGLAELMRILRQSQGRRWIVQLGLCCFVFWPAGKMMSEMTPVPVLPKVYAQSFLELRNSTEPDARLWQWWDYGYAGQYYAERMTFGDGGMHDGPWLYPLAKIHASDSPLQASQLMRFVTLSQSNSIKEGSPAKYYWSNPVAEFQSMGPREASEFVDNLSVTDLRLSEDMPAQYFVVAWENLRLASWISYYGNWDVVTGTSSPGKIQQVRGEVRVDSAKGALEVNGKLQALDSMDVIDSTHNRRFEWPNGTGMHVVLNQMSKQVFLMDSKMYSSMMVQMLIADPESFEPHFELVDDKFPWTRVYLAK
jgi:dolichyl-diphosphooligosaccharide--protein glycosyltransferase